MLQAWVNVAGLSSDFLGFCLLLREWWIAFLSESALMAHEEALDRAQKMRTFAAQTATDAMKRHLAVAGQMQDDMAINQARTQRRNALQGRRAWFVSASVLIAVGFMLQLAASLPYWPS